MPPKSKPQIVKTCAFCGEQFSRPDQKAWRKVRYCSLRCSAASNVRNGDPTNLAHYESRVHNASAQCGYCGSVFTYYARPSHSPRKYCSAKCSDTANALSAIHYVVDPVTSCWEWQRTKTKGGYGRINVNGHSMPAHRFYFESTNGPVPEGLEMDHLCHNPGCVNPDHLEAVTKSVNALRRRPRR
jgi:hypothetical protein